MRTIQVVAGIDPRHGGPSYSVPRLCAALRALDVDANILTVREEGTPSEPYIWAHEQDFAAIPLLRALRLSSGLMRAARRAACSCDVVHVHGLWLMPNVHAGRAAEAMGRPLVVSPRGMLGLDALAFSRRRKRLFWRLLQGPAYARAAAWHATSAAEAEDIRAFGVRAPIAVVPNGIDLPLDTEPRPRREDGQRTILHLGRMHPKKGLPDLIAAWARLAERRTGWVLRIVGPDERGHRAELERIAAQVKAPRITFEGPVYGEEKVRALRGADLFVLPTRNENFGLAVAEALASGTPAIVSRGAPWPGLQKETCGWWVERGVEPLLRALESATALSDGQREAMGRRGRAWMARDFSWDSIAARMADLYQWLASDAPRPEFVTSC